MNKVVNFQTPKKEQSHTCKYSGVTFPTSGNGIPREGLDFGGALHYLRKGYSVSREPWNNQDIYIWIESGMDERLPYLCVHTAGRKIVPWTPTNNELLALDWFVR